MLYRVNEFEKKTPSNIDVEQIKLSCGEFVNMYTIKSVNDLTQFIGFGKYINNMNYNLLMRCQADLYGAMPRKSDLSDTMRGLIMVK